MAEAAAAVSVAASRRRGPSGVKVQQWLFGGWTALVFAFLYIPILLLIIYSFNNSKLGIQWAGFTTKWYGELLADKDMIGMFCNSLFVASFTTVLATVLGTIGAWMMFRYRFPARRALGLLIFIPMVMPEVLMGVSLMISSVAVQPWVNPSLAHAQPIVDTLNHALAWTDPLVQRLHGFIALDPLRLPPLRLQGFLAMIIAHTTFCFPFVLVGVQARLEGIDPFLEEAAMDLGATPVTAFWKVIVPYLRPAIFAGALMSFTLSFDEYIVSVFLYDANSQTLPIKIYGMAKIGLNPKLNALSTIFVIATLLLVFATQFTQRKKPVS